MKEIDLPSGRKLKISPSPFEDAKNLYQAILEEMKSVKMDDADNISNAMKDLICVGFSSKKIEACLNKCLARCLIDDKKIDSGSFEDVSHREDYLVVSYEVLLENVLPFTKSLYVKYQAILDKLKSVQP
jgi:hypothetical protein